VLWLLFPDLQRPRGLRVRNELERRALRPLRRSAGEVRSVISRVRNSVVPPTPTSRRSNLLESDSDPSVRRPRPRPNSRAGWTHILGVVVVDHEADRRPLELPNQVPALLGYPGCIRIGSHCKPDDPPRCQLHIQEDVEPASEHGVNGEEVADHDRQSLGLKKRPPSRPRSLGRRTQLLPPQADSGSRSPTLGARPSEARRGGERIPTEDSLGPSSILAREGSPPAAADRRLVARRRPPTSCASAPGANPAPSPAQRVRPEMDASARLLPTL